MKALTLTQPWASLMAWGEKQIETRSWRTSYRGLVAIHAGMRVPGPVKAMCHDQQLFWMTLEDHGVFIGEPRLGVYDFRPALPLGAIVAVVELVDCEPTEYIRRWPERYFPTRDEYAFGSYEHGRYGWITRDVVPLQSPIPCKGRLGLWTLDDETEAQVTHAMREVA